MSYREPIFDASKNGQSLDMIVIAVCAVISGADTRVEVETFGKACQDWLESFLDLPHGHPFS